MWHPHGTPPSPFQSLKRSSIFDRNPDGMVIDVNNEQPQKHASPTFLTLVGIDTVLIDLQLLKQFSPILLTPVVILIIANESHPSKHPLLIQLTLVGILTADNNVQ